MGGSIYAGTWFENRDAFDAKSAAKFRTQAGSGDVMGTLLLLGLMLFGGTAGSDERWSWSIAIGLINDPPRLERWQMTLSAITVACL
jgi:hypothetical protein